MSYLALSSLLNYEILRKQKIHSFHPQSGMEDHKYQIFSIYLLRWTGFMFCKRVYVHSRRKDLELMAHMPLMLTDV